MASNLETIRSFIALWATRDLDAILAAMTEDCFYHNMPWPPVIGQAAIRASLEPFVGSAKAIDWLLHNIAESPDGVVLTERTDRFAIGDDWLEMPVMGTFELSDGKIAKWRDYFDPTPINAMMTAAA